MCGRKPRITTHLFPIYVTTVKGYGVDEEDFFFFFGVKYDHTSSHASRKRFTRYCIRRLNSGYTKPRSKVYSQSLFTLAPISSPNALELHLTLCFDIRYDLAELEEVMLVNLELSEYHVDNMLPQRNRTRDRNYDNTQLRRIRRLQISLPTSSATTQPSPTPHFKKEEPCTHAPAG